MNMCCKSNDFIKSLECNSFEQIKKIPKSDWHNHATMGGSANYLSRLIGVNIIPKKMYADLDDITLWGYKNHVPSLDTLDGYLKRIQASFVQASDDNIEKLALNFYYSEVFMFREVNLFINIIERFHRKYAPKTLLYPELSIKWTDDPKILINMISEIISYNWFKSIDICGIELAQPAQNFIEIYRLAKNNNLLLKAHVGETGTANDIMETIELLHLSQIHHGIAAVNSKYVIKYLVENQIQLNICPTSNIKLGLISDYYSHPIKKLYLSGVKVTLNTDDMLCFNSSVSEEYYKLFLAGTLSAQELNEIRIYGLMNS